MEYHIKSWAEVAPRLVAVAAGREAADLVVRGGVLVNVQSREILDGWQVAVADGRRCIVWLSIRAAHRVGCYGRRPTPTPPHTTTDQRSSECT